MPYGVDKQSRLHCFLDRMLKFHKARMNKHGKVQCIFTPTCSEYMVEAIKFYGLRKGIALGIRRLLRCSPSSSGGYDPVPKGNKL